MSSDELLRYRIAHQHLNGSELRSPADVVNAMGAMQAQEYAMAKWAIGLRLPGSTNAVVEAAFNAGEFLRTHVLRPTWHFVAPADLRWLLALTAPRIHAAMAYMNRKLELPPAIFRRSQSVFSRELQDGLFLTRDALQEKLRDAKLPCDGVRAAHLLMHAELEGLICSGPRQGKQFTYALLETRVPAAKPVSREKALAELSRRYFSSRGPATARDFSWWSGLTLKDARAGIATLGEDFVHETNDGRDYLRPAHSRRPAKAPSLCCLLPDYDEYGMAYADRSALFKLTARSSLPTGDALAYNRMIVIDGRVVGTWKRTEIREGLEIEAVWFTPPTRTQERKLTHAAAEFGRFFDLPISSVKNRIGN